MRQGSDALFMHKRRRFPALRWATGSVKGIGIRMTQKATGKTGMSENEKPEENPIDDAFRMRLSELRAEIDGMDDQLIALIKQRCEFVKQVGALKKEHLDARCFIRPGREATMVRRIAGEFDGHSFSAGAAAAIWRLVIAASTSIEQQLKITAYFQPQQQEYYWLAREYFGMFSSITKETVASRALGQVIDGKALVGVLPSFDVGSDDAWWRLLLDSDAANRPNIFACLPFATVEGPLNPVGTPLRAQALAVGFVDCEDTGDDVTYLVIDGKHDLSQSRIQTLLTSDSAPARWLQVLHEPNNDRRLHLIEIDGFHTQESALLKTLHEQCYEQLHRVVVLGSHAKPILLQH